MQRFKTKFFILLLAFFVGIIAYKGYLFIASQQLKDQSIAQASFTVTKKQIPNENNSFTIEPCKEDVNTSKDLAPKKEKRQSNSDQVSVEGSFKLDDVNSLVLCGNLPDYPDAIKSHVSGLVNVEIHVNKSGRVISAKANDGPNSLLKQSVESALQTRFNPYYGRYAGPFYFSGILTYEFNSQRGVKLYKPTRRF